MNDIQKIKEFFSKPLNETKFKVGDKITYLGHPGVIKAVNKEMTGDITYTVSYDKGTGKTTASNISNKGGEIKMAEAVTAAYEAKEESYMISKSGSKFNPYYVLEKPDGSKQIDMMFSSPEEAKKYAAKKNLKISSKPGYNMNEAKSEDPVDTITMDIPLFLRMLEYSREDASQDMDLHDVTEKANKLGKEKGILSMEDYEEIVGAAEEIKEGELTESKSFTIDSESASDSDKITDFLTKNNIDFKKVGSKIKISLDRNTPKASSILSKLKSLAKFDELNEVSDYMKRRKAMDDYAVSKQDKPKKPYNPTPSGKTDYMKRREAEKGLEERIAEALNKINEELCPAGKAYIKRRKAAGEKSSAYLSGRAVKVCKGQMSGKSKKK